LKLLMVGSRFLLKRHEGDKNFWLELVEELKSKIEEIHILSLNSDYSKGKQFYEPNIWLYNLSPTPFPIFERRFSDIKLASTNNYISKSLSFIKILKEVRKISYNNDIDIVHFIDNYGPIMSFMKLVPLKAPSTVSAISYHPRYFGYDLFLKLSLSPFKTIVASSSSFMHKLVELGFDKNKIKKICWGVNTLKIKPKLELREDTREQMNINPESKIVLWSGFLQQTSLQDFFYSIDVANEILKLTDECTFIFCFKHVHFRKEYLKYQSENIKIISTGTNEDFIGLVNASDVFICPVLVKDSIVAPPLTWLEVMAYGIPVVTNDVKGAEEVIQNGINGYITKSKEEMVKRILEIITNEDRRLHKHARDSISHNHDIKIIANEYLHLWNELVRG